MTATWLTAEQVQRWKLWLHTLQARWAVSPSAQRGRVPMAYTPHANQRPGEPSVSACVAAMQQMLQVIAREAVERRALERTVQCTQAALAQALADEFFAMRGKTLPAYHTPDEVIDLALADYTELVDRGQADADTSALILLKR